MSKIKITLEQQTARGILKQTERQWPVYCSGQIRMVTVKTDSCTNSRSTWMDRDNAYNRTIYTCECGRASNTWRRPSKKHLNTHDSWWTKEYRNELAYKLAQEADNA